MWKKAIKSVRKWYNTDRQEDVEKYGPYFRSEVSEPCAYLGFLGKTDNLFTFLSHFRDECQFSVQSTRVTARTNNNICKY